MKVSRRKAMSGLLVLTSLKECKIKVPSKMATVQVLHCLIQCDPHQLPNQAEDAKTFPLRSRLITVELQHTVNANTASRMSRH